MIHFSLVTLDGIKFSEDVHEVMLPTPQGQIAIFEHHIPLVSIASPGIIVVRQTPEHGDDRLEYYATNGGVIEIVDNNVRVLVDEADREDEINEAEALEAYERARKLHAEARDPVSISKAQSLVDRHATRLKVADIRRNRRRK